MGGHSGGRCEMPAALLLTLLHHANIQTALESAGLAVTPVVFSDAAVPAERAREAGLALHAASDTHTP